MNSCVSNLLFFFSVFSPLFYSRPDRSLTATAGKWKPFLPWRCPEPIVAGLMNVLLFLSFQLKFLPGRSTVASFLAYQDGGTKMTLLPFVNLNRFHWSKHQWRKWVNSLYQDLKCAPSICTPQEIVKLNWIHESILVGVSLKLLSTSCWRMGSFQVFLFRTCALGLDLRAWHDESMANQVTFIALGCWFLYIYIK